MRLAETLHTPKFSPAVMMGVAGLLVILAAIPSFRSFIGSGEPAQIANTNGKVQEEAGFRIVALTRFDQDRKARLREEWDNTLQQYTVFENGIKARYQEALGQSIATTARAIWIKQEAINASTTHAKSQLQNFIEEQPGAWQEKLGMAVVTAYRRTGEIGEAFLAAYRNEVERLRTVQQRTLSGLVSDLGSLNVQKTELQGAVSGMYQEAIQEADRSVANREVSAMAQVSRIFDQLQADLSWKRAPEDYARQVAIVRENQNVHAAAGGFLEYGLWAVVGLLVSMVWVGASITMDPVDGLGGKR